MSDGSKETWRLTFGSGGCKVTRQTNNNDVETKRAMKSPLVKSNNKSVRNSNKLAKPKGDAKVLDPKLFLNPTVLLHRVDIKTRENKNKYNRRSPKNTYKSKKTRKDQCDKNLASDIKIVFQQGVIVTNAAPVVSTFIPNEFNLNNKSENLSDATIKRPIIKLKKCEHSNASPQNLNTVHKHNDSDTRVSTVVRTSLEKSKKRKLSIDTALCDPNIIKEHKEIDSQSVSSNIPVLTNILEVAHENSHIDMLHNLEESNLPLQRVAKDTTVTSRYDAIQPESELPSLPKIAKVTPVTGHCDTIALESEISILSKVTKVNTLTDRCDTIQPESELSSLPKVPKITIIPICNKYSKSLRSDSEGKKYLIKNTSTCNIPKVTEKRDFDSAKLNCEQTPLPMQNEPEVAVVRSRIDSPSFINKTSEKSNLKEPIEDTNISNHNIPNISSKSISNSIQPESELSMLSKVTKVNTRTAHCDTIALESERSSLSKVTKVTTATDRCDTIQPESNQSSLPKVPKITIIPMCNKYSKSLKSDSEGKKYLIKNTSTCNMPKATEKSSFDSAKSDCEQTTLLIQNEPKVATVRSHIDSPTIINKTNEKSEIKEPIKDTNTSKHNIPNISLKSISNSIQPESELPGLLKVPKITNITSVNSQVEIMNKKSDESNIEEPTFSIKDTTKKKDRRSNSTQLANEDKSNIQTDIVSNKNENSTKTCFSNDKPDETKYADHQSSILQSLLVNNIVVNFCNSKNHQHKTKPQSETQNEVVEDSKEKRTQRRLEKMESSIAKHEKQLRKLEKKCREYENRLQKINLDPHLVRNYGDDLPPKPSALLINIDDDDDKDDIIIVESLPDDKFSVPSGDICSMILPHLEKLDKLLNKNFASNMKNMSH